MFYINKLKRKYQFYGGLSFASYKKKNNFFTLKSMPFPKVVFIPVKNYLIRQNKLCVSQGDKVLTGDLLLIGDQINPSLHASISGYIDVIKINKNEFYFDNKETIISIISDDNQNELNQRKKIDYKKLKKKEIIKKIYQFGIVGLGGSGFSCATKLQTFENSKFNILIVNAVECEPYVVADECLIQNHVLDIFLGCEILVWILNIECVLIAIEDNKLKTIEIIVKELINFPNFKLRKIPSIYPSGSSKQLIKILLNKEIPSGMHSNSMGILIHNVGTLFAIKRAVVNSEPLIKRIVTIAGSNVYDVENYWIRIGTPISHILDFISIKSLEYNKIIIGGLFSDYKKLNSNQFILKTTNCILFFYEKTINNKYSKLIKSSECIRCSKCFNVCPMHLLPQQLYWYSKSHDHDKSDFYNIMDCIECGLCEQVCPSNIRLVSYFKKEKEIISNIKKYNQRSKISKIRFKKHEKRLQFKKSFCKSLDKNLDNIIH